MTKHGTPVKDRLMSKLKKMPSGCWEWQGATLRGGYGNMKVKGKNWQAHRLSYDLFVSPIPDGMLVCHRCDNPSCCNPTHLFLGTSKDNTKDKMIKGRHPLGESAPNNKLREEEIKEVRRYADLGVPRRTIAKMFRVGSTCITYAVNGKTWGWLE